MTCGGIGPDSRATVELLLVADSGGHLFELAGLRQVWRGFTHAWVTVEGADVGCLPDHELIFYGKGPTRRNLWNLVRNAVVAVRVIRKLRPRVMLTTGAGLAVPFAWVAWVLRVEVVYVESAGRIDTSLSCRLVAPIAKGVYVQWPEGVSHARGARYLGSVFFSSS